MPQRPSLSPLSRQKQYPQYALAAKEAIGSVKAPKQVTLVDDFPRTPVGKIDKKQLRNAAWSGQDRVI